MALRNTNSGEFMSCAAPFWSTPSCVPASPSSTTIVYSTLVRSNRMGLNGVSAASTDSTSSVSTNPSTTSMLSTPSICPRDAAAPALALAPAPIAAYASANRPSMEKMRALTVSRRAPRVVATVTLTASRSILRESEVSNAKKPITGNVIARRTSSGRVSPSSSSGPAEPDPAANATALRSLSVKCESSVST